MPDPHDAHREYAETGTVVVERGEPAVAPAETLRVAVETDAETTATAYPSRP